jgi:hypothetical protein
MDIEVNLGRRTMLSHFSGFLRSFQVPSDIVKKAEADHSHHQYKPQLVTPSQHSGVTFWFHGYTEKARVFMLLNFSWIFISR